MRSRFNAGGAFAYRGGQARDRRATTRDGRRPWRSPSTARGLAFAPKGYRLAISHYNGATLWFPNVEAKPEILEWKGSHLDVTWSPDARFVVTSMQENALHGWRLQPDKGHMRMSGYPVEDPLPVLVPRRQVARAPRGRRPRSSGRSNRKEGPMGKAPRECGVRPAKVTRVAFHPRHLVLAVGYEDGCILLIRLDGRLRAAGAAPDRRQGQRRHGPRLGCPGRQRLAFGCEDGAGRHPDPAGLTATWHRFGAFLKGAFGSPKARRRGGRAGQGSGAALPLEAPPDTPFAVNEIACTDPGCPGIETVILVMEPGRKTRAHKVAKPLDAVTEQDVRAAFKP